MKQPSTHTITTERSGSTNGMDWSAEYTITFKFTPGRPMVRTLANGDPGHPADPDEIEFVSVNPVIGPLDHGNFTDLAQQALDAWAENWLSDKGEDDARSLALEERSVRFD